MQTLTTYLQNIRKCWVLILLMVLGIQPVLKAQQRMRYSQYLLNPYLTNPALTGVEPYWDIRAGAAQQWVGFDGAPRSVYLTAHKGLYTRGASVADAKPTLNINSLPTTGRMRTLPTTSEGPNRKSELEGELEALDISDPRSIPDGPNFHLGVGFQMFSEQTGPISYTGAAAAVAANLRIVGGLRMAIGANMEMINYRLNTGNISFLNPNDIAGYSNQANLLFPTMNAGIVLYSQRFFLMGSTRQLMRSRIAINPSNPVVSGLETHYWFQAGLRLKAAENVNLMPSIALRQVNPAPPSLDLSLQGAWKETVYLGLSYRVEDAIVIMAGFRFTPELRLDYAYDFTTSELGSVNAGSHSLVLSFFPRIVPKFGRKYFW